MNENHTKLYDISPNQTVVIIDDEFTSRTILQESIRGISDSLTIHAFSNPIEAVLWIRENNADLILLDYRMDGITGYEVLCELKSNERLKNIPVIIVTAETNKKLRHIMLDVGATDFVNKPIDHRECALRCKNILLIRKYQKQLEVRLDDLEIEVRKATNIIEKREKESLLRLAKAGEFRDEDTGNHVMRMAQYSKLIAQALGLSTQHCDLIENAAPMHDIGKIGITDSILLKPGKLTADEYMVMKTHAEIGYEILKDSDSKFLALGAQIALGHHEKYDGTGYPHGLKGEEIPLEARIVAVADVYDALTSSRPYKKAWSNEDAMNYLEEQKGKHFDPQCVEALKAKIDKVRLIQINFNDEPEHYHLLNNKSTLAYGKFIESNQHDLNVNVLSTSFMS